MAYVKNTTWVAGGAPGISAVALNNLETQYNEAATLLTALKNILTTRGDLPFRGASDWARLAKGSLGQVLTQGANDPAWAAPPVFTEIEGVGHSVTFTDTGGYEDWNISASIPVGTKAVLVSATVNIGASTSATGARKNGSTLNRNLATSAWAAVTHICEVGSDRTIEVYRNTVADASYNLMGYWT